MGAGKSMKQIELPKVAIVGRPNVGKSSIYNRIIRKRESIIDPTPGVTRDRHYHPVQFMEYNFLLIDTGGITLDEGDSFSELIKIQSEIAITEADLILFVVEVSGMTEDDYKIADLLRKSGKELLLIVNKCDNLKLEQASVNAYEVQLGAPFPISASHGLHFHDLLEKICEKIPSVSFEKESQKIIQVAIVGKPNVGKSTLLNQILGEERSLVSDIPGTTRDTIQETVQFLNYEFQFLDTAGMRRKSKVTEDVEYYSVNRAVKSIEKSDIVIHLIDSVENISEQDKKIMGIAMDRGRGIIIALNKWDLMDQDRDFKEYTEYVRFKFAAASYIPVTSISAETGLRVKKLLKMIIEIYKEYSFRIGTNEFNELLQMAQQRYVPPSRKGRLKIYYGTQISTSPPKFLLFVNNKDLVTKNYRNYLSNQLRTAFGFHGVPIFIYTRKSE